MSRHADDQAAGEGRERQAPVVPAAFGARVGPGIVELDLERAFSGTKRRKIQRGAGDGLGGLALGQLGLPGRAGVAAPDQQRALSAQGVNAQPVGFLERGRKLLGRRVQPANRLGKAPELPPELLTGHIGVPVPDMAGAGGAAEEGGKQDVVEEDAVGVLVIEQERAGVAGFHGAALGQEDRAAGGHREQLAHGVGGQDVHGPFAHREPGAQVEVSVDLRDVVAGHGGQAPVKGAGPIGVKAAEALEREVPGEKPVKLREHCLAPAHVIAALDGVDLVPEFPAKDRGVVAISFLVPGQLGFEPFAAGRAAKEIGQIRRRAAIGHQVERFGGPGLAAAAQVPEMLQAKLDADAVFGGQSKGFVDAGRFGLVELARALVFDVKERRAEPDPDVIAAVLGELAHPGVHAGKAAAGRGDHVQADGDVRPAVGEFQIAGIARAGPHEHGIGRGGGGHPGGKHRDGGGEQLQPRHVESRHAAPYPSRLAWQASGRGLEDGGAKAAAIAARLPERQRRVPCQPRASEASPWVGRHRRTQGLKGRAKRMCSSGLALAQKPSRVGAAAEGPESARAWSGFVVPAFSRRRVERCLAVGFVHRLTG